jgi:hypothetical protein
MGAGQLFSNNASTQSVNAPLGSGDLTLTVTATEGAFFEDVLVADEFEMLTLMDDEFAPTVIEIVKVTAHDSGGGSPDDFTIVRGQEGTTPAIWPAGSIVQARNTAKTLDRFVQSDPDGDARGLYAINIQRDRDAGSYVASGTRAIAIGQGVNRATASNSVAIGNDAYADGADSLAVGFYAEAQDQGTTALGQRTSAQGTNSTCVGYSADTFHDYALAIQNCQSGGYRSIQMGAYSSAGNYGFAAMYQAQASAYGVALGGSSSAGTGQSTALGYAATAGTQSVAVGGYASATSYGGTAVGRSATAGNRGVAVGHSANATGLYKLAIGYAANASGGDYAHAIGHQSTAAGTYGLAVGYRASAGGTGGVAVGYNANAAYTGSIAIGYNAAAPAANVARIGAPIVIPGLSVPYSDAGQRLRRMAGCEVVLLSNSYDLTDVTPFDSGTLGNKDFWVMPAGLKFYPDEVGIVTETQTGVTTGPTVSFGHGGTGSEILSSQLFASAVLGQSGGRGEYASVAPEGVGTVSIDMVTGATATTLTGRFFVRGLLLENGS